MKPSLTLSHNSLAKFKACKKLIPPLWYMLLWWSSGPLLLLVIGREATDNNPRDSPKGQLKYSCESNNLQQVWINTQNVASRTISDINFGLAVEKYGWPEVTHSRSKSTPLNMTKIDIFLQIKETGLLKDLLLMKTPLEIRDKSKYYFFHDYYDHNMKECRDLKEQIEEFIHRGHLGRFIWKP